MIEVSRPHNQVDISRMLDVASGRLIAHMFVSNLEPPTIVFETATGEDHDRLTTEDVYAAELALGRYFQTGVLYGGVLPPADAALTAAAMIRENRLAVKRS